MKLNVENIFWKVMDFLFKDRKLYTKVSIVLTMLLLLLVLGYLIEGTIFKGLSPIIGLLIVSSPVLFGISLVDYE